MSPTGPDGESERSWMTAGVLCVHGAEQGETLCSTAQLALLHSPFLFLLFFLLPTRSQTRRHDELSSQWSCYSLQVSPEPAKPHDDLRNARLLLCSLSRYLSSTVCHPWTPSPPPPALVQRLLFSLSPSIFVWNNHCIFRLSALRCRSLRLW